ncbi:MAG: hypothetical protein HN842_08535, partial [Gammaproteobacteria bacterium]|nr:hypothetical protein [Gammaproteobacteria bacterium]
MRRKKQWIINLLLPLAVIDSSMAEMEPTLDELLDGFEEELPRLSDESLDTVL